MSTRENNEQWGSWQCPYDGCDDEPSDPDSIWITNCGEESHVVLLGPPVNGTRWASKHVPTDQDIGL